MAWGTLIMTFLRYFPEFVDLVKTIIAKTEEGMTELRIKSDIRKINEAFNTKDRALAARMLNDVFRGN